MYHCRHVSADINFRSWSATIRKTAMKRSRIVGLLILVVVVVALALNYGSLRRSFVGLNRGDFGLCVAADLVTTPVTDWSFPDAFPTIQIETRTWYLIPHFVRTY